MKIIFSKKYDKSFDKLPLKIQKLAIIAESEVIEANSINEIFQLKPLRKKDFYSINIGNSYRIGIKIRNDEVIFISVGHRSDIYSKFP
ncbi:MAG: type II toxin-antitoxin system RelE/ParE family toxin [Bacteroidota bacterium]|nr:type II toxin-antitoxin system RelE/ParE family toxin [Bacteroidota bacterium]